MRPELEKKMYTKRNEKRRHQAGVEKSKELQITEELGGEEEGRALNRGGKEWLHIDLRLGELNHGKERIVQRRDPESGSKRGGNQKREQKQSTAFGGTSERRSFRGEGKDSLRT